MLLCAGSSHQKGVEARESNGGGDRGPGFKLAKCGDTWGTGNFSGAQGHGHRRSVHRRSLRGGQKEHGPELSSTCLPLVGSIELTPICLSHTLNSGTGTAAPTSKPLTHIRRVSIMHRDTHMETETHPPGATQAQTLVPWLGKVGRPRGWGVRWALVLKADCMQATSHLSPRLTRPTGSQQGWGLQGGRRAIQQTLRPANLGSGVNSTALLAVTLASHWTSGPLLSQERRMHMENAYQHSCL